VTSVVRFEEWQEPTGTTAATTDSSGNVTFDNDVTVTGTITSTGNPQGLTFIKSQTIGSGASSVTVTNAFSATFENYQISVVVDVCSGVGSYVSKFGAATTNYYSTMHYDNYGGGFTNYARTNNGGFMYSALSSNIETSTFTINVINPHATKNTQVHGTWQGRDYAGWCGGVLKDTTSHTSYVLTTDTGTMTGGIIRVYGYNNG
jgi:hypothetical protein